MNEHKSASIFFGIGSFKSLVYFSMVDTRDASEEGQQDCYQHRFMSMFSRAMIALRTGQFPDQMFPSRLATSRRMRTEDDESPRWFQLSLKQGVILIK